MLKNYGAYLLLGLLSWQLFSLPLTYAWFYTNQAAIAAEHCINIDEPIPMCYGQCYLGDIVSAQLAPDLKGSAPAVPTSRSPIAAMAPALLPAPLVLPKRLAPRLRLPQSANYWYQLRQDQGYRQPHAPPPKRLS